MPSSRALLLPLVLVLGCTPRAPVRRADLVACPRAGSERRGELSLVGPTRTVVGPEPGAAGPIAAALRGR